VGRDDVAMPAGYPLDRRLERCILERLDLAAVVADEVVVMVAPGVGGLEASDTVAQVDALEEAELVEPVERPVDARDADPHAAVPEPLVDLQRGEAAVLAVEVGDDLPPRSAASPTRLAELRERRLGPPFPHNDNDSRSQ